MRKICTLLGLLLQSCLFAQQTGAFSHSFRKMMVLNPAYAGSEPSTNAFLASRIQWTDFKNAPRLNIFTLDGSIAEKKMGIGIDLISDRKGISNKTGGHISYAYRLRLGEESSLAFGLALGVMDHTLNYSKAVVEDASDPFISGDAQNETSIDGNAGLLFRWKSLEIGASVPQLLGDDLEFQDNVSGRAYYALSRHYLGSLKYSFTLSDEKGLFLSPMAIVRFHPNAPLQYDAQLNLEWKDKFWIGGTYKSDYAVSAQAGCYIGRQLALGYSYDFMTGPVGSYSGMSHEIMLQFRFGKAKAEDPDAPQSSSNTAAQQKVDSLTAELELGQAKRAADQQKIAELQEKLKKAEAQKKEQSSSGNKNQNSEAISGNQNKVMNDGVWMATNKANEFKDVNNHIPQKGYYVIVGTFVNREFAEAEVKRFTDKGFGSANWVFFEQKQYNYVFITRVQTKEEAVKKANEVKAAGIQEVWIQSLVD